jgi:hypothetical protein
LCKGCRLVCMVRQARDSHARKFPYRDYRSPECIPRYHRSPSPRRRSPSRARMSRWCTGRHHRRRPYMMNKIAFAAHSAAPVVPDIAALSADVTLLWRLGGIAVFVHRCVCRPIWSRIRRGRLADAAPWIWFHGPSTTGPSACARWRRCQRCIRTKS